MKNTLERETKVVRFSDGGSMEVPYVKRTQYFCMFCGEKIETKDAYWTDDRCKGHAVCNVSCSKCKCVNLFCIKILKGAKVLGRTI